MQNLSRILHERIDLQAAIIQARSPDNFSKMFENFNENHDRIYSKSKPLLYLFAKQLNQCYKDLSLC